MAQYANEVKLFNKFALSTVQVNDIAVKDYITIDSVPVFAPHTAGRYSKKPFRKAKCPIVERLVNSMMMHGRNAGKKLLAIRIVRSALEIIALQTKQNPIQVLADAVAKAGPREDSTRIGAGGVVRRQAVDVSPLRRINQAVYLMTQGARAAAFRNLKSIAECLADEIMNAAQENQNSYAMKKKEEIERVAKANR